MPITIERRFRLLLLLALGAAPAAAQMPWIPFGARAVAMGGAAVALPEGAASVVENPACAGDGSLAVALSAGAVATESGDFLSPLRIVTGNSPAALAAGAANLGDVRNALRTLADPGNGVLGDGHAGIVATSKGWALALSASGWGGSFVRADLVHLATGLDPATSVLYNTSAAAYRALVVKDLALSNSRSFLNGALRVGVTVHALKGTATAKEESAFTTDVGDPMQMLRRGTSGAERTATRFTWDAGVLVTVGVLKVGGVVRAVNQPVFPFDETAAPAADRGRGIRMGRQARVGASAHVPVLGVTLSADYDITPNETMIPGLVSRDLGGGAEFRLGPLALRGGAVVNLDGPSRVFRYTGGVGLGLGPVKVDAAAVYHPGNSALGAVVTGRVGL